MCETCNEPLTPEERRGLRPGEIIPVPRVSGSTYADRMSALERRQDCEAEARGHLAGQFHEAMTELIDFATGAVERVDATDLNHLALLGRVRQLAEAVGDHIELTERRQEALATALRAVYEVTKPRPSIWRRLLRFY